MDNQESEVKISESEIKENNDSTNPEKKLSSFGWALLFIWIGISFLAEFPIGLGLLGIGIITLGLQLVRKTYNLKIEGFWLIIGLLFVLGGLGKILEVELPLVPIVFILAGLTIPYSILKGKEK